MIEKLEGENLLPAAEERRGEGRGVDALREREAASEEAAGVSPEESPAGDAAAREESAVALDPHELRGALEAVLFSVSEPVTIRALAEIFKISVHEIRAAVEDLRLEYVEQGRAFRLEDIAGGVQLLTVSRFDPWVRRLRQKEREGKLSQAALESLSVIAYKQPIGKADLEAIRGVGCGPTLKTLLERGLIQVVGRSEALGKPLLYGTTRRFLESFGIGSVKELPQPELPERPGRRDAPPASPPPVEVPAPAAQEAPSASPESMATPGGPELS